MGGHHVKRGIWRPGIEERSRSHSARGLGLWEQRRSRLQSGCGESRCRKSVVQYNHVRLCRMSRHTNWDVVGWICVRTCTYVRTYVWSPYVRTHVHMNIRTYIAYCLSACVRAYVLQKPLSGVQSRAATSTNMEYSSACPHLSPIVVAHYLASLSHLCAPVCFVCLACSGGSESDVWSQRIDASLLRI